MAKRKKDSKTSKILAMLLKGEEVTNLKALGLFGAFRLSDIIFKLRNRGYPILCEAKKDVNGAEYGSYRLVRAGDEVWVGKFDMSAVRCKVVSLSPEAGIAHVVPVNPSLGAMGPVPAAVPLASLLVRL